MSEIVDKTKNKEVAQLQKLGLSEKESRVYLALLPLGQVGSSKVISASGLHGQYVYQALESLEDKGLAQSVIMRGRKKFSAKPPTTLSLLADEQKRLADEMAERLQTLAGPSSKQQSETYQGRESFVAHEFSMIEAAPAESTLLIIGGEGDKFGQAMAGRMAEYESLRMRKQIKVRYIGSEAQRTHLLQSVETRLNFEYKLLPGLFTGLVNTNIWSNAVGFNIFGDPVTNFTITNKEVAASYGQFFNALWQISK